MLEDGLYRVEWKKVCAGFIVDGGLVVRCAPILKKRIEFWKTIAKKVSSMPKHDQPGAVEWNLNRLTEWIRSNPRKPAVTAFTAGPLRQAAYAVEDVVREAVDAAKEGGKGNAD